ncbi:MAG: Asp-tRNA(Asn)/Glu-tRNA(Gln) amidotransferase subunit GatA, partial [Lachnospiraceae bacterium]|nr:Asp-tRNA(Asn)/Glu-tRNA(Gln) amidotransferase subunit GatA [Lachnospiraceae bacterium]
MQLSDMTAVELAAAIKDGKTTAMEAVKETLARIEEKEETIHCYVTVDKENALAQAEAVQRKIEAGELTGALAGVPVAVKDNLCTEGMLPTC